MSASDTRQKLTGGGYLGMLNVLMQLRKVRAGPRWALWLRLRQHSAARARAAGRAYAGRSRAVAAAWLPGYSTGGTTRRVHALWMPPLAAARHGSGVKAPSYVSDW